jgi:hypothetical protein
LSVAATCSAGGVVFVGEYDEVFCDVESPFPVALGQAGGDVEQQAIDRALALVAVDPRPGV